MIQVQNLTAHLFPRTGVEDLSFSVEKGKCLGILGNVNSGRTSLLELLCGVLAPHQGDAIIGGYSIKTKPLKAKKLLGYMPQQAPFFPNMTVYEHLAFIFELRKVKLDKRSHLGEIIKAVEIEGYEDHMGGRIPQVFQRKLSFACALVGYPQVLLLDRPTTGLNPNDTGNLLHIIGNFKKDHTILFTTSSPVKAEILTEDVLLLDKGKMMAYTTFSELHKFSPLNIRKVHIRLGSSKDRCLAVLNTMTDILWEEAPPHEKNATDFIITSDSPYIRERISQHLGENQIPLLYLAGDFVTLEQIIHSLRLADNILAQPLYSHVPKQ